MSRAVQRENEIKKLLAQGNLDPTETYFLVEELNDLHQREAERLLKMHKQED